ncbi:MAG: LysR family transcriptional regulator [Paracoccus sp. (in: a-proteobacteria)]|nr:LysR family transcriptional regulator [Paracoccus sp. (in: a-proteobacteria)]
MSRFNIRSLDLNLLSVFVVLWDLRSVSRAADQLALTQPAISHALKRLRDRLEDPLFVRGQHGLMPTPRAAELIDPVRKALDQIERALTQTPPFDPASTVREFRIATLDLLELWLLPPLLERLAREAPGLLIRCVPMPARGTGRALLEAGDIDIIADGRQRTGMSIHSEKLTEVRLSTLIWRREGVAEGRFPLNLYLDRPHVLFQGHDKIGSVVDETLAAYGQKRRIGAVVQTFSGMPAVAARTGFICNLPRSIANSLAEIYDLSVHEPPLDFPSTPVFCSRHSRFGADPALKWLLECMRDAVGGRADG